MGLVTTLATINLDDLVESTGNYIFRPTTKWMSLVGLSSLDFVADMRAIVGSPNAIPAIQYAESTPDRPDDWAIISGTPASSGTPMDHFRQAITTTDKFWFRLGLAFKDASGTPAFARAQVKLQQNFTQSGRLIGSGNLDIPIGVLHTLDLENYWPITRWVDSASFSKVQAAFLLRNVTNANGSFAMVMRQCNDQNEPSAWVLTGSGWTAMSTSAGNFQQFLTTQDAAPTGIDLTANMYFQMGVALKKSVASTNPQCNLNVVFGEVLA